MTRTIQRTSCPHRSAQKIMPLSDKAARCHAASVQGGHNGRPARSLRPRHRFFSNLRMPGSFSVLSFLSGKEKKEPKKRNLNGGGCVQAIGRANPVIRFLFFPAGLFFQKSPAKYFLRGMCVPLTGGHSGPTQAGLWLSLWFFFLPERKENGKKIKKASPTAGVSGRRGGGRWLRGSRQSRDRRWSFRSTCRDRRRGGTARARRRRRYAPPPPAARRP